MRSLVILSALALAACSTVPAEGTGTAAAGGACKDEGLSSFVGGTRPNRPARSC